MKRIYFITGLPLSGKSKLASVACKLLSDVKVISTGNVARSLIGNDTKMREEMAKLDLFPDEQRLRNEITNLVENSKEFNIIVDGMPRFGDQVRYLADKFWHYFPKILMTEVGDLITLYKRAKARARDEYDKNDKLFIERLYKASANIADVPLVAKECMIPVYNVFTTGDDVAMGRRLWAIINDVQW
jgi:adenylate kinase family enzyme